MDIDVDFGKARKVETKFGQRSVREGKPTEKFWSLWQTQKEELKAAGYSLSKYNDEWKVSLWSANGVEEKREVTGIVTLEPEWGSITPYKHQIDGVEYLRKHPKCILADDMGLGKTVQALVAARCFGFPIVVICPKSLVQNWAREANKVDVPITVFPWSKLPESISGDYFLIADEAHYAQAGKKSQRGAKFIELAKAAKGCYALTGTPIKNGRPINLLPLLQACEHPLARNTSHYHKYYCNAHPTHFSRWDTSGASHLKELHENLKDAMIRRLKKHCLDLPEKTRVFREVELSASAEKIYNTEMKRLRFEYEERLREGKISNDAEAMVMLGHCRQAGSVAKVETAIELAEEILSQDQSVVIFTEFLASANMLHEKLGGVLLTGDTVDRQKIVDDFQSGKEKVFIATTKAGGVGITLTAASTAILVDRPWTPGDAVQAEDRLHRIGQGSAVTAVWLQHGIDSHVDGILQKKEENITQVLEGEKRTMSGLKLQMVQLLQMIFRDMDNGA